MGWFTPGRGSYAGGVSFGSSEASSDTRDTRTISVITGSVDEATTLEVQRGQSTNAQFRITYTSGSVYTDFKVDSNHDLTIKPTSTGQIKIQPTTDSTDFFSHFARFHVGRITVTCGIIQSQNYIRKL